jgi:diguanylate cyclase (GGDEF)-like protein
MMNIEISNTLPRVEQSDPGSNGGDVEQALAGSTVMMIDDDQLTLEVIQTFLNEAGYSNIITLSQPEKALETIHTAQPDVVLLDLLMPGVNGFDILRLLRADTELRYIPVIMLTAASDADTKLQALELGAADFLAKPVDPSELSLRLRNTLAFKAYRDRLAYFDSLTDLPNRRSFIAQLRGAMHLLEKESGRLSVLHVDLDRFKHINDTLGYSLGDALLKAVAGRFINALRDCEKTRGGSLRDRLYLARFSGDEFTVLVPSLPDESMVELLARRMTASLSEPFRIGDHELFISASLGIAVAPGDGDDAVTLLKNAEIAMHAAKAQEIGRAHV